SITSRTSGMRRATGATHGGARTSMRSAGCFSCSRARSGCALSASPIQFGATTRMRGKRLGPPRGGSGGDGLRAAVGAQRLALVRDVQEHPRVARPQRRAGQRAVQRQVLLLHLYLTGVSHERRFLSLPVTTAKNAFCSALVMGPALPAPM